MWQDLLVSILIVIAHSPIIFYKIIIFHRTLDPHEIQDCCKYKSNTKDDKKPEWRPEYNLGKSYIPSYNIAPTDISPVLVSASHFDDSPESENEQVVVPMMWGMIPRWHKVELYINI